MGLLGKNYDQNGFSFEFGQYYDEMHEISILCYQNQREASGSHCTIKGSTLKGPLLYLFILDLSRTPLFSLEEINGGWLNEGCGCMATGSRDITFVFC